MARRPTVKPIKRPRVKPIKRPAIKKTGGAKRKNAAGMISKTRSKFYMGAKFLGDVNAGISGDATKIGTRFIHRIVGKKFAQGLGSKWFNLD
jgi:hypothetical protein